MDGLFGLKVKVASFEEWWATHKDHKVFSVESAKVQVRRKPLTVPVFRLKRLIMLQCFKCREIYIIDSTEPLKSEQVLPFRGR